MASTAGFVRVGGVDEGCHSALERYYLRDVERAHKLTSAVRGRRTGRASAPLRRLDRAAEPMPARRLRDRRRL